MLPSVYSNGDFGEIFLDIIELQDIDVLQHPFPLPALFKVAKFHTVEHRHHRFVLAPSRAHFNPHPGPLGGPWRKKSHDLATELNLFVDDLLEVCALCNAGFVQKSFSSNIAQPFRDLRASPSIIPAI